MEPFQVRRTPLMQENIKDCNKKTSNGMYKIFLMIKALSIDAGELIILVKGIENKISNINNYS